jgi:hypothetical protein
LAKRNTPNRSQVASNKKSNKSFLALKWRTYLPSVIIHTIKQARPPKESQKGKKLNESGRGGIFMLIKKILQK